MLKIRMSRGGAKKRPFYKIVVADSRRPRDGKFIEKVGFFNPLLPKDKKERLNLDIERIKYWLAQGAQPSERIARFLGQAEVIPMPAQRNNPIKAKPKKKAQEKLKAAAEAKQQKQHSRDQQQKQHQQRLQQQKQHQQRLQQQKQHQQRLQQQKQHQQRLQQQKQHSRDSSSRSS